MTTQFFQVTHLADSKKNSGSSILQLGQFQTVSNCPVTGVCHRVLSGFTEAECCYSPVDLSSFFWRIALLRNANFFRASSSAGELGFQLCLALSLICESLISLYSVITKKPFYGLSLFYVSQNEKSPWSFVIIIHVGDTFLNHVFILPKLKNTKQ